MLFERPICEFGTPHPTGRARRIGSQATAPLKSHGTQRVPVVLVQFQDVKFMEPADTTCSSVNEFYQKFCNGTMDGKRYRGHGSSGSIRDYFVEQSDSAFFPEFEVIGPVTLDSVVSYYGKNSPGRDTNYGKFTKETLKKAVAEFGDWSTFDNDKNGTIDLVFFIYAGMGEHNTRGMRPELLWPKESQSGTTIDGTTFGASGITSEARPLFNSDYTQIVGMKTDGIGVFVHELSHALGLPDFYDTKGKAFGMDMWSVMDYGEYANNGDTPGNYTAYERDFMGWRRLVTLEEPCVLNIPCFYDGGKGYKIVNEANPNEYYVIENRQPKGWDTYVGQRGHGLQVTHVDYDAGRWNSNNLNTDAAHQRMTIIAANNDYFGAGMGDQTKWLNALKGNLFPGDKNVYELTDESSPAARVFSNSVVYTGATMHKPLRNITENEDGTITVCYCTNGQLPTMEAPEVENVMMDRFDAHWPLVENATKYGYELRQGDGLLKTDTIAETSISIENLLPSIELQLRVKALADRPEDYIDGEWSEWTTFSTLSDGIRSVGSSSIADVYTMSGLYIGRRHINELSNVMPSRGIYILRLSDGTSRKILLK